MNRVQPSPTNIPESVLPKSPSEWKKNAALIAVIAASAIAYYVSGWIACAAVATAGIAVLITCSITRAFLGGAEDCVRVLSPIAQVGAATLEIGGKAAVSHAKNLHVL